MMSISARDNPSMTSGHDPVLDDVIEEMANRLQAGEPVDGAAILAKYPDRADAIRRLLPAMEVMAEVMSEFGGSASRRAAGTSPGLSPLTGELGTLGDFRVLREVGRGGMGIVYEAEQMSLGRRVALKVLPFAGAMDSQQLRRFRIEAQAAAQLYHTHIVPVFWIGSEQGVHYYAMQFIEGHTLADVIRELRRLEGKERGDGPPGKGEVPGDPAASALASAMTREFPAPASPEGIPSPAVAPGPPDPSAEPAPPSDSASRNRCDFRNVARLGMEAAEALEHAHQEGIVHRDIKPANLMVDARGHLWVTDFGLARLQTESGLTITGDLLGTLRYMSPEQALGRRAYLDHRTDIYSLGATLYELLTLKPAFDDRDRQELLRQIALEEPKPPRRVNKAIPRDLETIVLRALAKNPAERYATARELADDLRRFLRDEPILARRSTMLQRARRWAWRHRPLMVSAAVALLAALTVLAGSIGWIMRDRAARQARWTADLQAALNEGQRFQEEGLWPQAMAAARRAEILLQDGTAEPIVAERVTSLLRDLAEQEADGRLVARLDAIRLRQADVKDNEFVLPRSRVEYQQAFGAYGLRMDLTTPEQAAAVLRRRPPSVRSTLLAALDHWLILASYEKAPEAGWLKQVLAAADSDPWRQGVRAARAKNDRLELERLAREVDTAVQPPEALFVLELGLAQRGATEAALALLRRAQQAFPGDFWINHDLGMALHRGNPPHYEEAIRFLTAAVALRPDSAGVRFNLGNTLARARRADEAIDAYRQAIDLKPDYSVAHLQLGLLLAARGRLDEAIAACRRAIQWKPDYGDAFYSLGTLLDRTGRGAEALAAYRRAVELMPDHAESHCNLGLALRGQGDYTRALAALERGHELGSRRKDWGYPSSEWVSECRRKIELDGRLAAVLRAEVQPADAAERKEYAELCYEKKLHVAAARFFSQCLTDDPKSADELDGSQRYRAACAAAQAGCGQGDDAGQLDDRERFRWRKQALHWLRDDLKAYGELLPRCNPGERQQLNEWLRSWQSEPALAGLRDPKMVAHLSAAEQESCRHFWAEVQALLANTGTAE